MSPHVPENAAASLARALSSARRIVAFTGAGVSTASGIPDFRGPSGVWKRRLPVLYDDFLRSETARTAYWEGKCESHEAFAQARPNAAHEALVRLEKAGRLSAVITQNIDGLHQEAGTSADRLVELHGTNRRIECLGCGELTEPGSAVQHFRAMGVCPRCACGGLMKFATVSFGQAVDPALLQRAATLVLAADVVLSLGSTLSVQPAASIPLLAVRRGVPYVVVNQGATEHDAVATLRLEGDVAELLPLAVEQLLAG